MVSKPIRVFDDFLNCILVLIFHTNQVIAGRNFIEMTHRY